MVLRLGSIVLLAPRAALAQEAGRIYRLGCLSALRVSQPDLKDLKTHPFFYELNRQGFILGKNLAIDWRGWGVPQDRMAALAHDFVEEGVDAFYAAGDAGVRAAQDATRTLPIVAVSDDLLAAKFVASFARPGGNITGVSILARELDGKRQELMIEMIPGIRRLAMLIDPATTEPEKIDALVQAARLRGIEAAPHRATSREEAAAAIAAAKAEGAEAINVLASARFYSMHPFLIERVAIARLPAIYQWPEYCAEGALTAYGPSLASIGRLAAQQIVKVLRGASPGEIPVEQPRAFELAINLTTAKSLGLTIPPALLARADEVIE
jgi:putative tryptophan/tyrosine transport system substrate-binding protein